MGIGVGAMYAYLETGFVYTAWAGVFVIGLVFVMWLGRNL